MEATINSLVSQVDDVYRDFLKSALVNIFTMLAPGAKVVSFHSTQKQGPDENLRVWVRDDYLWACSELKLKVEYFDAEITMRIILYPQSSSTIDVIIGGVRVLKEDFIKSLAAHQALFMLSKQLEISRELQGIRNDIKALSDEIKYRPDSDYVRSVVKERFESGDYSNIDLEK